MNNIFLEVQEFAKSTGVQQEVKDISVGIAEKIVKGTLDPEKNPPVEDYKGIVFSEELEDEDEYILVHDFFKSSQLDFPAQVLSYESQHPNLKYNRRSMCERLGLDADSKEPMLVQLIRLRSQYSNPV